MTAAMEASQISGATVQSDSVMIVANIHVQPRWCVANGNHTAQDAR